jgi:putative tricarboxylic transport membrane protein
MQRAETFVGLICVGLAAFMAWQSWLLEYYSSLGPGPGFFPFWLAIIFGGLSLSCLFSAIKKRGVEGRGKFFPERKGLIRKVVITAGFAVAATLLEIIGFRLAMLAFVVLTYLTLGGRSWTMTLLLGLGLSFGVYYAFTGLLDVSLPQASIKFLNDLGL